MRSSPNVSEVGVKMYVLADKRSANSTQRPGVDLFYFPTLALIRLEDQLRDRGSFGRMRGYRSLPVPPTEFLSSVQ